MHGNTKIKFVKRPVHAMHACLGSRSIAPLVPNFDKLPAGNSPVRSE